MNSEAENTNLVPSTHHFSIPGKLNRGTREEKSRVIVVNGGSFESQSQRLTGGRDEVLPPGNVLRMLIKVVPRVIGTRGT